MADLDWPEGGRESLDRCPVCGSMRMEIIYSALSDIVFQVAPGKWTLVKCLECRSAFINPRPTLDTIGLAYARYFTHDIGSVEYSRMGRIIRYWRRSLSNGYKNWRFGSRLQPASSVGMVIARVNRDIGRRIDASMRHLPVKEGGGSVLDFGCGNGDFLRGAKAAGWKVVGVDFDPKAVTAARASGLDVREGGVELLGSFKGRFDVVTLSHVVEHVHDPIELLRSCFDCLRPGGCIWVETPNIDALGHGIYGAGWRGLEPPRHLVLFSRKGLVAALRRVGFEQIADQPYRPLCRWMFEASELNRMACNAPTGAVPERSLGSMVRRCEKEARRNPSVREFVTVKGWRPR